MDPTNMNIVVRSATNVALKCKATGNPPPKIIWRKINDQLPAGGELSSDGMTFTMFDVNRHHAGLYECEAGNGVGTSVKAEISLKILYGPEVSAEFPVVHGGIGRQSELSCVVYAVPSAEVVWYRETMRLDPNGKRYMESRGSRHTLIIRKVEDRDFANYSCYAINTLGKVRGYITLRGNPTKPVFNSLVLSKTKTSYKISWVTNSYSPILEYRLFYRMLSVTDSPKFRSISLEWHKLRLPPTASYTEDGTHQETYVLGPLHPDSSYEAKVMARSHYGWSDESSIFQFYTQGKGTSPKENFVKKPEVQDLGLASVAGSSSEGSQAKQSGSNLIKPFVSIIILLSLQTIVFRFHLK
nr:limbic system-associated membrane protein-like [Lepeophtheirus salmonis]